MDVPFLQNIPPEVAVELAGQVSAGDHGMGSKPLARNPGVSVTLMAFARGEGIAAHVSSGDAMVLVLEGTGRFMVAGTEHTCQAGQALVMPAGKPHAVFAPEAFKMLLTVVFPVEDSNTP